MASIHRRVSKTGIESWRVGYREPRTGRLAWTPTLHNGQGAAELKTLIERLGPDAALAILERRSGRDVETSIPLLSEYFTRHLERLRTHATRGTIDDYRRMADRTWLPHLGPLPLDAITADAVEGWITWQREQETDRSRRARAKAKREKREVPPAHRYTPKSIANAHGLLSAVLDTAATRDRLIPTNPARGIKLPSDSERAEKVFLTADEFAAIYAEVATHYKPLVATLYGTGMRWGEATALQSGDVELDTATGVITVRRAWKKDARGDVYLGSAKTKTGHRTITIAQPLVSMLREQLAGLDANHLVFTSAQGGRVRSQNFHPRVWHRAVTASGIAKRPDVHSLRHSHVAALVRAGVPLPVIQRRLGHESIQTTIDVYGHLAPDVHLGAADAAGAALSQAVPFIEAG